MSGIIPSYSLLDLKNNPNVGIQIGREIEKMSWLKSPFEPLAGRGSDRMIRAYSVDKETPYRPRLKTKLKGLGVRDNEEFATNYDELEILSQTMFPKVIGNSLLSPIYHYSNMQQIDFEKEAKDSLATWMMDFRDKQYIAALTNDLTNCVVADSTNGFKDVSNETSVRNASSQIVRGDVISVKTLRRAIFMARAGKDYKNREIYPIKPLRAQRHTTQGLSILHYSYVIMLDTHGIQQLQNDEEWRDMQKYAGERGDKNNLFTGLSGMIDGCPVLDFGVWGSGNVGLMNSNVEDKEFLHYINLQNTHKVVKPSQYAKDATNPVCIGFLVGASALLTVGSDAPNIYTEERDAGRKQVIAMDRLMAISKARFGEETDTHIDDKFKNKDFAVIGIFYSKE